MSTAHRQIEIDVQYLPDITEPCPTCHGSRFREAVLEVRLDDLTIAEVLDLTVADALDRFAGRPEIVRPLAPIDDVRASADFRRAAALILVRRAIEGCIRGEAGGIV